VSRSLVPKMMREDIIIFDARVGRLMSSLSASLQLSNFIRVMAIGQGNNRVSVRASFVHDGSFKTSRNPIFQARSSAVESAKDVQIRLLCFDRAANPHDSLLVHRNSDLVRQARGIEFMRVVVFVLRIMRVPRLLDRTMNPIDGAKEMRHC